MHQIEREKLAQQAQAWLSKEGLDPAGMPDWNDLPAFPDPNPPSLPVWRVSPQNRYLALPTPEKSLPGLLEHAYDPQSKADWAFIPGLEPREVWLMRIKRQAASDPQLS